MVVLKRVPAVERDGTEGIVSHGEGLMENDRSEPRAPEGRNFVARISLGKSRSRYGLLVRRLFGERRRLPNKPLQQPNGTPLGLPGFAETSVLTSK